MSSGGDGSRMGWVCRGRVLPLSAPVVMGILNTTPDSFSDGGRHHAFDDAVARGRQLAAEGAAILDIGGESTRPGFTPVDAAEERRRTIPVIRALRAAHPDRLISIDTMKADVAEAAMDAGADIINDVSGLSDPRMADVARASGAGLVLMHGYACHVGAPRDIGPDGLGAWVEAGLVRLLRVAREAGLAAAQLVVDPGFGFGKRHGENADVLRAVPALAAACGRPVLIAGSRKHFVTGMYPDAGGDRLAASVAFACEARRLGGLIFRVHDVMETCNALGIALQ